MRRETKDETQPLSALEVSEHGLAAGACANGMGKKRSEMRRRKQERDGQGMIDGSNLDEKLRG
jgi:hypothetical protein